MAVIQELKDEAEEEQFREEMEKFNQEVREMRQKYEPTAAEKIFSVVKAMILRALMIYFLFWIFRGKSTGGPMNKPEPASTTPVPPVDTFFEEEAEPFDDFEHHEF